MQLLIACYSVVRFNHKAGAAARVRGEEEAFPGTWEVVAWGDPEAGAEVGNAVSFVARKGVKSARQCLEFEGLSLQHDLDNWGLHATESAFLVVNKEDQVAAWGDESSGGATLPITFTHEHQAAGVSELYRSFAIVLTSGEALITGTSIVRGVGSGSVFVAAIGTPCIPGYWGNWGLCSGSCTGSRTRERAIAYKEQHGGSCSSATVDIEACPGYATSEECSAIKTANTTGETEADSGSNSTSSSSSSALSVESILGLLAGVVGLIIVVGTIIYLWKDMLRRSADCPQGDIWDASLMHPAEMIRRSERLRRNIYPLELRGMGVDTRAGCGFLVVYDEKKLF
ncbi:hypothetical protein ACSSS7_007149 [Eimeria intestinalis]